MTGHPHTHPHRTRTRGQHQHRRCYHHDHICSLVNSHTNDRGHGLVNNHTDDHSTRICICTTTMTSTATSAIGTATRTMAKCAVSQCCCAPSMTTMMHTAMAAIHRTRALARSMLLCIIHYINVLILLILSILFNTAAAPKRSEAHLVLINRILKQMTGFRLPLFVPSPVLEVSPLECIILDASMFRTWFSCNR